MTNSLKISTEQYKRHEKASFTKIIENYLNKANKFQWKQHSGLESLHFHIIYYKHFIRYLLLSE